MTGDGRRTDGGLEEIKAATVADRRPRCDHICLQPADHVDEGKPHFYGYELPSPRQPLEDNPVFLEMRRRAQEAEAEVERLRASLSTIRDASSDLESEFEAGVHDIARTALATRPLGA